MARSYRIFNKGSLLPSIIELEAGLIESEDEESKRAEETVREARLSGDRLIKEVEVEIIEIERDERKKLLEEVDATVEKLEEDEERRLHELERLIEKNRKRVLDHILMKVIPGGCRSDTG